MMKIFEADPMETINGLIDQMIDGGMTPDELGKAIERLDAAPESWRRCAGLSGSSKLGRSVPVDGRADRGTSSGHPGWYALLVRYRREPGTCHAGSGTSLAAEIRGDGSRNCLDRILTGMAEPRSEEDTRRAGAEGGVCCC